MPKKKYTFLIILLCITLIPIDVMAASFSKNEVINMCGWDQMPAVMPKLTSALYLIIRLLIPVVLIVLGMVDFLNGIMAQDKDKMSKPPKLFLNY